MRKVKPVPFWRQSSPAGCWLCSFLATTSMQFKRKSKDLESSFTFISSVPDVLQEPFCDKVLETFRIAHRLNHNTTWLLLNCFIDFWGLCGWLYWRLCLFFTVFLLVRLLLNAGAGWWIHTLVLTTQRAWRCTLHATLPEAALSYWNYSGWIFHLSPVPTAMPAFWHRHPRRRYGSRRYKWEVGQGSCLITADRGGKDVVSLHSTRKKAYEAKKKEPFQMPALSQRHQ